MSRHVLPLTAALAALCAAAPAAHATSVTRTQGEQGPIVTIEDAAGVADALTLTGSVAGGAVVSSAAGKITALAGCTQTNPVVVTCDPGASQVFAILGIGIDKFNSTGADFNLTVNGGRDDDTFDMSNSTEPDTFIGGGPVSSDGGGKDTAIYAQRNGPVIATQDGNANDGANASPNRPLTQGSDEHDNIASDVEI